MEEIQNISGDTFQWQMWLDLIWLPVSLAIVHKGQRIKAFVFVLCCIAALRMQLEFIQVLGFEKGFFNLIDATPFQRGLIIYSVFIMLFLILSYFSPGTKGFVYMAAAISLFFMAFVATTFLMIL